MTPKQMEQISNLIRVFGRRQKEIIEKYDGQRNRELGRLDNEFEKELKQILISKEE